MDIKSLEPLLGPLLSTALGAAFALKPDYFAKMAIEFQSKAYNNVIYRMIVFHLMGIFFFALGILVMVAAVRGWETSNEAPKIFLTGFLAMVCGALAALVPLISRRRNDVSLSGGRIERITRVGCFFCGILFFVVGAVNLVKGIMLIVR